MYDYDHIEEVANKLLVAGQTKEEALLCVRAAFMLKYLTKKCIDREGQSHGWVVKDTDLSTLELDKMDLGSIPFLSVDCQ